MNVKRVVFFAVALVAGIVPVLVLYSPFPHLHRQDKFPAWIQVPLGTASQFSILGGTNGTGEKSML